jgi:hypothetical protein
MNSFLNYIFFHHLLSYCDMSREIIQSVAYDNYDDFQHVNFVFHKFSFHYFEDYLMTKLTLGIRYIIAI